MPIFDSINKAAGGNERAKAAGKTARKQRTKDYFGQVADNLLSGENKKISVDGQSGSDIARAVAAEQQHMKMAKSAEGLGKIVDPSFGQVTANPYGGAAAAGGIDNTTITRDRSDQGSNASMLYRKKMGY